MNIYICEWIIHIFFDKFHTEDFVRNISFYNNILFYNRNSVTHGREKCNLIYLINVTYREADTMAAGEENHLNTYNFLTSNKEKIFLFSNLNKSSIFF